MSTPLPSDPNGLPSPLDRRCREVAGRTRVLSRHDQGHGRSRIWRLATEHGPCFLKAHGDLTSWRAEVQAYSAWVPALRSEAPRLIAAWEQEAQAGETPAILVTALPGIPASDLASDAEQERACWRAAGAWLARWHAPGATAEADPSLHPTSRPADEATAVEMISGSLQEWLDRGRQTNSLSADEVALAHRALAQIDVFAGEPPTPCHGDWRPQNWIVDPAATGRNGGWSGVIDFEHARLDVRLADIGQWWDRGLAGRPDLQEAFFAGYGCLPTETERTQISILRLVGALGRVVAGHRARRAEIEALGRRTLQALAAPSAPSEGLRRAHPTPGSPSSGRTARLTLTLGGAVQGVGFRPFVYRLAHDLALSGWVVNDARGVVIDVEGDRGRLEDFRQRITRERPQHAVIESERAEWGEPCGYIGFDVRASDEGGGRTATVLPDLATCPRCLAEIADPSDRHHRYPFTNCTHCGPRFTILDALPYDRPNTTMRSFAMCPSCRREYHDPLDRRFHAQPTACPECGPRLAFLERATGDARWEETASGEPALLAAASAIRQGLIAAVKGLGGFHLVVDAGNGGAVAALRARKRRPTKPFALMTPDLEWVRRLCHCTADEEALLTSREAPILLLPRRVPRDGVVAEAVAPGNPTLGLMLPATPLHHLLLAEVGRPVVATSGNLTDEPICIDSAEAMDRLGSIADVFLVHDRAIVRHVDDSIVRVIADAPRLLRRARGHAPLPVLLADETPTILAVGGHLKNTVALSVGRRVFISQHIGGLESPRAFAAFERVIDDFLRLYGVVPAVVACDTHPDYRSTQWARAAQARFGPECRLIAVQHHHAHLAACLAENGADGPCLGIVWDGAGYGPDKVIWGGEGLVGDAASVCRAAHLRPFRLPGGDAAVREPRRAALALLYETFGDVVFGWEDLAPVASFEPRERQILASMLSRGLNAPLTTSAGRLFDGLAALAGLGQRVDFEGEAAMALEFAADHAVTDTYPFGIEPGDALEIDWRPIIASVVLDVRRGTEAAVIAARFHNSLVEVIHAIAQSVGHARVALSGGCFQNKLLVERAARRLQMAGYAVLLHRRVPPNDGGISLGQVAVATARTVGKELQPCVSASPERSLPSSRTPSA